MIARAWKGVARDAADADAYLRAVVEPEARAALAEYGEFVRHYEVDEVER